LQVEFVVDTPHSNYMSAIIPEAKSTERLKKKYSTVTAGRFPDLEKRKSIKIAAQPQGYWINHNATEE